MGSFFLVLGETKLICKTGGNQRRWNGVGLGKKEQLCASTQAINGREPFYPGGFLTPAQGNSSELTMFCPYVCIAILGFVSDNRELYLAWEIRAFVNKDPCQ